MLKSAFLDDGIDSLQNLDNEGKHKDIKNFQASLTCRIGWIAGDVANVFVTNHDTERVRIHSNSDYFS